MSIESAVYDRLNHASITGTVSTRIYPTEDTDWPFVVYRAEATDPIQSLSGLAGITLYSVTIDVWARSVTQRTALADAIRARLASFRGGSIAGSFYKSEQPETLGTETEGDVYHSALSFSVWYTGA